MRRRDVLRGALAGTLAVGGITGRTGALEAATQETIGETYWDSTASLLTPELEPITSDENVLVRARESAVVTDEDGNGDATEYGDTRPVLAARDGSVVGLGAMLVGEDTDFAYGNDEFLLNVYDELTGGGGRIVWDEGHDQYWVRDQFATFLDRAGEVGYTIEGTDDVTSVSDADLLVVTTPATEFTDAEIDALASLRDSGTAIVLHDQSDYNDLDQTANLNAIAEGLGLAFRFNDDQVIDESSNAGAFFQPVTDVYPGSDALFAPRDGVPPGPQFSFDQEYTATVGEIDDGDTFEVTFDDGATEEVRVLGVDTPEVPAAADAENPHEWEGLADEESGDEFDEEYPHLQEWAGEASAAANEALADETVTLTFDENEGIEGPFGRLLAYVTYDEDGSGSRDRLWSRELIENGLARVYDSGHARHDELLTAELAAREEGRGVWEASDPNDSRTLWNDAVEELFFPEPVAVSTFGGDLPDERVPVRAPESAGGAPLAAVDPESRVAAVGGIPVTDDYLSDEFPLDAEAYGNPVFLTNLLDALADRDGDVLWDGGHGQFDTSGGVSVEAASRYQRYLEGVDLGLEQINDYGELLSRGRALVVTPPASGFSSEEAAAVRSFRDEGGAVVVAGTSGVSNDRIEALNALLAELGSNLTLDTEQVTSSDGPEGVVTTTAFDDDFGLFGAFESDTASLIDTQTATPTATREPTTTPEQTPTTTAGPSEATTGSSPGFGTLTGVAGAIGGGVLALRRLLDDEE